jgi:IS30 family transposase
MRKKYLQLTYQDRVLISHWRARGLSLGQIALRVGVHKSTVSRELKRNLWFPDGYWSAVDAQRRKDLRTFKANQKRRCKRPETKAWVIEKLKEHWSPEQIAGRSKLEGPQTVSHEYVYRLLILDRKRGGSLYRLLKRHGRRKQRLNERAYGLNIPNRKTLEKRPKIVQKRNRLGDLEADLIQGYCHSGYILTIIDRKSRFVILRKLRRKKKTLVRIQIERAMRKLGAAKTLTVDNGTEFCDHEALTRTTRVPVYFTHPYCSTERGSVENANGLVRHFLRKKTCFKSLTQRKLNEIQDLLNHRPRKCLDYLTPFEVQTKSQPPISIALRF